MQIESGEGRAQAGGRRSYPQFSIFNFQFSNFNSIRKGVSLLEVLAAIGVLSIGMLGLAAPLPIGRYTLSEATKADRAGQCGRAALHDVIVRRMLDPNNWNSGNVRQRGLCSSSTREGSGKRHGTFGGSAEIAAEDHTAVESRRLATSPALADSIFMAADDLVLSMPEDMNPPPHPVGRPLNISATAVANNPLINAHVHVVLDGDAAAQQHDAF